MRQGGEFGLRLTIEFQPLVRHSRPGRRPGDRRGHGRPNGRVLFDTWHHGHSALTSAWLAPTQASLVSCVQIDDAQPPVSQDLIHESTFRRCLPGTGTLPLTPRCWVS